MKTSLETFEVQTTAGIDILDISDAVQDAVRQSRVKEGQAVVFVGGSTGSVTTIEYESGVVADLKEALQRIAPMDKPYKHDAAWHDGNGYSHVLAALLGPSRAFPITGGTIPTGTWQQIVLVDLDNKPRRRRVMVGCMGEAR